MDELAVVAATGAALGVVYGLLGVAVAGVAITTRVLHLAVGAIVAAAVPLQAALAVEAATGIGRLPAVLLSVLAGALVAALLTPLAGDRERDLTVGIVGLVVAGGVIEAATSRWLGATTLRPEPLLALGDLGVGAARVEGAVVTAIVIGLPGAVLLAWALTSSRLGVRLQLVGGSPEAADQVGFRLATLRGVAFATSGAAAVVAGLLVAPVTFAGPSAAAGLTVRAVAAGAVLGLHRPRLALLGGLLIGFAESVGANAWPAAGGEVAVTATVLAVVLRRSAISEEGRPW